MTYDEVMKKVERERRGVLFEQLEERAKENFNNPTNSPSRQAFLEAKQHKISITRREFAEQIVGKKLDKNPTWDELDVSYKDMFLNYDWNINNGYIKFNDVEIEKSLSDVAVLILHLCCRIMLLDNEIPTLSTDDVMTLTNINDIQVISDAIKELFDNDCILAMESRNHEIKTYVNTLCARNETHSSEHTNWTFRSNLNGIEVDLELETFVKLCYLMQIMNPTNNSLQFDNIDCDLQECLDELISKRFMVKQDDKYMINPIVGHGSMCKSKDIAPIFWSMSDGDAMLEQMDNVK